MPLRHFYSPFLPSQSIFRFTIVRGWLIGILFFPLPFIFLRADGIYSLGNLGLFFGHLFHILAYILHCPAFSFHSLPFLARDAATMASSGRGDWVSQYLYRSERLWEMGFGLEIFAIGQIWSKTSHVSIRALSIFYPSGSLLYPTSLSTTPFRSLELPGIRRTDAPDYCFQ